MSLSAPVDPAMDATIRMAKRAASPRSPSIMAWSEGVSWSFMAGNCIGCPRTLVSEAGAMIHGCENPGRVRECHGPHPVAPDRPPDFAPHADSEGDRSGLAGPGSNEGSEERAGSRLSSMHWVDHGWTQVRIPLRPLLGRWLYLGASPTGISASHNDGLALPHDSGGVRASQLKAEE